MMSSLFKQRSIGALWMLLALSLVLGSAVLAQTVFNRFGPSDGILVGDSSTYFTTSATSSDILALWTGTCTSTTYLRGDGSCQVPPSGGGGTPGGLNGYVQYNNAGSFSGDAGLTYNDSTDTLSAGALVTGVLTSTTSSLGAASSSSLTVSGNADLNTIDSIPVADFARKSQANSFSTAYAGPGTAPITLASVLPIVEWFQTDAPPDNGIWRIYADAETLCIGLRNDTDTLSNCAISFGRSGATSASINLQATSVQVNGSTVRNGASTRVAYAQVIGSGSGCTISGSVASQGISGCSRTGVGQYNLTFNAGFASLPACVVSGGSSNQDVGFTPTSVTTGSTVMRVDGAAGDGVFFINCMSQ